MLSSLSATDIAFAMIGVMQGVLALVWLLATWLAYATLSAVSFAMLTAALHLHAPPRAEMLRALGNLCGVVALIALQRGIRLFVGFPLPVRAHLLALGVALVASYVGLSPSGGRFRVSIISGVLALLAASVAP